VDSSSSTAQGKKQPDVVSWQNGVISTTSAKTNKEINNKPVGWRRPKRLAPPATRDGVEKNVQTKKFQRYVLNALQSNCKHKVMQ